MQAWRAKAGQGVSFGAGILEVVKVAVLRSKEEIGDAVVVPVDRGGAGVVPGEIQCVEIAHVLEKPLPIALTNLAPPFGIGAVYEDVERAVAIPIDQAELAASALPAGAGIEAQWLAP